MRDGRAAPLRKVVSRRLAADYTIDTLECGHEVPLRPSEPSRKRRKCIDCDAQVSDTQETLRKGPKT